VRRWRLEELKLLPALRKSSVASSFLERTSGLFFSNGIISKSQYSRTPLLRINWDIEPSGYAQNPDNWSFL
jgi:hypothetical protein